MYETIYTIDPASMAYHRVVLAVLLGAVVSVSAGLVVRFGWRSWWGVSAAAIGIPVLVVKVARQFSGAPPSSNMPFTQFILGVVMPLAVPGILAAATGAALGAMLRWLLRRASN